jgi:hypothetical protein
MPRAYSLLFASTFLVVASFASDNKPDYHVNGDAARELYKHSAFAHGLRHGYEEGYHAADLDIHTGSPRKDWAKMDRVPKTVGFKNNFGNKKSFRRGYEYGYVAGYADSFENRKFHYPAADLSSSSETLSRDFDLGVSSGYQTAYHSNAADLACDRQTAAYCAGFKMGADMALAERHSAPAQLATGTAPK